MHKTIVKVINHPVVRCVHWGVGTASLGALATSDIVLSTGNVSGWVIFVAATFVVGASYRYCRDLDR